MEIRLPIPQLPRPSAGGLREGWRASFFTSFWGVPSGPIGWIGARLLPFVARRLYVMMGEQLQLQPDDDILDVGCGSAEFLKHEVGRVRYLAGLDASQIQVDLARARLSDAIAAGSAEIVLGDAAALPWEDGRFSAVASLNCVKFLPDPQQGLTEMYRVLRPGGRAVITLDPAIKDPAESGTVNAFGERQWSAADAHRMMEAAGFADVSVTSQPAKYLWLQVVRGVKPD